MLKIDRSGIIWCVDGLDVVMTSALSLRVEMLREKMLMMITISSRAYQFDIIALILWIILVLLYFATRR
jgi:hypothetical protein